MSLNLDKHFQDQHDINVLISITTLYIMVLSNHLGPNVAFLTQLGRLLRPLSHLSYEAWIRGVFNSRKLEKIKCTLLETTACSLTLC